jgi:hypothetical protein
VEHRGKNHEIHGAIAKRELLSIADLIAGPPGRCSRHRDRSWREVDSENVQSESCPSARELSCSASDLDRSLSLPGIRGFPELANQCVHGCVGEWLERSTLRLHQMIEGCRLELLILNALHSAGQ